MNLNLFGGNIVCDIRHLALFWRTVYRHCHARELDHPEPRHFCREPVKWLPRRYRWCSWVCTLSLRTVPNRCLSISFVRVGPAGLTKGTISDGKIVPTVLDNAFEQGVISAEALGISFEPASNVSTPNGLLTFGGSDSSRFVGNLNTLCVAGRFSRS